MPLLALRAGETVGYRFLIERLPKESRMAAHGCDTAICFNVLEHVEDDVGALVNMRHILTPGGRLLLIVPALSWIFGTVDRSLGHYRRYTPAVLRARMAAAGFEIEQLS